MEVKEIQAFVAVAKNKSVTRAAEALGQAQPTVSRRLKNLEKIAGQRLFMRNKRPLQLTNLGERLFAAAAPLVRSIEHTESILTQRASDETLSVMASGFLAESILPKTIQQFTDIHPEVKLNLRFGNEEQVAAAVVRGETEIGISHALVDQPGLVVSELGAYDYVLLAAPDHPIQSIQSLTLEVVADFPLVLGRMEGHARQVIERKFNEVDLHLNAPFEVGNIGMIKKLVASGFGLGIIPRVALIDSDYSEFLTISLSPLIPLERVLLLRTGEAPMSQSANDLISLVSELVRAYETEIGLDRACDSVVSPVK